MEKLQLDSSYTWQLIRLIQHFTWMSLSSVFNNFWLWSNVNFGQMMRKKYDMDILEEFYVEYTQLQLLWGVKKK